MDEIAEYFLGGALVLATLYMLVRVAFVYFFPKDT
jgi:hypothetical protein